MFKISQRSAIGLVALLLVGVAGVIVFTRDEFSEAKKAVKYVLKDPDSAKFRNIVKSLKNDAVFCGEVNARNSNNGFSGFHSFVYDRALKRTIIMNRYSDDPGRQLVGLEYYFRGECPYLSAD